MTHRNNHVVIDDDELDKLNEVAEQRFGTTEVPWGAVIGALADDYLNDDH